MFLLLTIMTYMLYQHMDVLAGGTIFCEHCHNTNLVLQHVTLHTFY
jgi:hypothetical protein